MSAIERSPHPIDVAAIDVGYFATKFTLSRPASDGNAEVSADSIPSFCPRVVGPVTAPLPVPGRLMPDSAGAFCLMAVSGYLVPLV